MFKQRNAATILAAGALALGGAAGALGASGCGNDDSSASAGQKQGGEAMKHEGKSGDAMKGEGKQSGEAMKHEGKTGEAMKGEEKSGDAMKDEAGG